MENDPYQRIVAHVRRVYWQIVAPLAIGSALALFVGLYAVIITGGRSAVLAPIGAVVLFGLWSGGFIPRAYLTNVAHHALTVRGLSQHELLRVQQQAARDAYPNNTVAAAILLVATFALAPSRDEEVVVQREGHERRKQ